MDKKPKNILVTKFNLTNTLEIGFGFGFSTIAIQKAHLKKSPRQVRPSVGDSLTNDTSSPESGPIIGLNPKS